ncbi:MAG: hypothetical protein U0Q03_15160 [Acidimicrobiales bacterium]
MHRRLPSASSIAASVTIACCASLLAACGTESRSDETIAPLLTTTTVIEPSPVSTTAAPVTTVAAATTVVPTSAESTSTTTSTSSTTTTSVPKAAKLALQSDGLDGALFGADPEQVIAYVTAVIGAPTDDSGWIDDTTAFPECPGTELRVVRWGDLHLLFGDESPYGSNRRHFFSYVVGPTDGSESQPVGLRTAERIGVGNTVGELRFTFPDTVLWDDELRGPSFIVGDTPDGINGTVTDFGDDERITMVMAGPRCDG